MTSLGQGAALEEEGTGAEGLEATAAAIMEAPPQVAPADGSLPVSLEADDLRDIERGRMRKRGAGLGWRWSRLWTWGRSPRSHLHPGAVTRAAAARSGETDDDDRAGAGAAPPRAPTVGRRPTEASGYSTSTLTTSPNASPSTSRSSIIPSSSSSDDADYGPAPIGVIRLPTTPAELEAASSNGHQPTARTLLRSCTPSKPTRACLRRIKPSPATMFFLFTLFLFLGGYVHYLWRAEAALSVPWVPDPESRLFAQRPLLAPAAETGISSYELPLRTRGRDIVDQRGRRFKLASVNWYGASDELFIPGGLDVRHRSAIAGTIRGMGFNSVRLPYADELLVANPTIMPHLLAANPDLVGLNAVDIFEACVTALTDAGLAVIVNNHITHATWCCGADPCDAGWANDHLGPLCRIRQTEEDWIRHWEELMGRFRHNPLVIGADLRNEVRGVWGTMPWDRWASAAERAGNRLLRINPDLLIIVGGTESGNDLRGAGSRPVVLNEPSRVVYSAHVYAWSGWGSLEGRYSKRGYASFVRAMRENWGYLVEGNTAPVWVGEFGAPDKPSMGTANYWQNLLRYLKVVDADFGYWAVNPRKPKDNEKETYALVRDDWETPILDYRMKDMTDIMRAPQEGWVSAGKAKGR